mmetsp:Transcript_8023/g.16912  ORF Transcript_8023/g.16912 Transcript_8023/m.16912 type:complete len:133 (-) Transcript_8023:86-484(-)
MGQVNVNAVVAGIDWNDDGAGVTVCGLRGGVSCRRGLELGFNPGLGLHCNGQGLYVGARAGVGIRDGVNVGVGALAVAGDYSANADAVACAHLSGCEADAAADAFKKSERLLLLKELEARAVNLQGEQAQAM